MPRSTILLLSTLASGIAGCTVQINLGCQEGETQYATDATFARGCESCTCTANGSVVCDDSTCGCLSEGTQLAVGDEVAAGDGCNTCKCSEDGSLTCTELACNPCDSDPPPCADRPDGCAGQPVCDPTTGWYCVSSCGCDDQPLPDCPAPQDGCFYDGPICIDGAWSCGDLICSPCTDPVPDCGVPEPGCWTEVVCTDQGWSCEMFCDCMDPMPVCPPETFPTCDPSGQWVCEPINTTCRDIGMIDCGPPPGDPACAFYATCHEDGGWYCQEDCPSDFCMQPTIECQVSDNPLCGLYPVCTSMDWTCAETCS